MPPTDKNAPGAAGSDYTGGDELSQREQELLAKVQDVAQRITARVRQVLKDTGPHQSLPTEENPPLA